MKDFPRLSAKTALILEMLAERRKAYGLELVDSSAGRLKRGSIYVMLNRTEDQNLISSWLEDAPEGRKGPPRRLYKITGQGERALNAYQLAKAAWGGSWGLAS